MAPDSSLAERLAGRLSSDGIVIYLFHGVVVQQRHKVRNYTGKHMPVDAFAECVRVLAAQGHPLSMDDVLEYCQNDEAFPPRAFAVTFDDGFANNLTVAAPILADLGVPMTIYVTSGFIEENGMSWIDRIEYAVEEAPDQEVFEKWMERPLRLADADSRISFLKAVRRHVKSDPSCDANAFADELCARLGKPGRLTSDDPLDLKMTWEQVRAAHSSEHITIGGHSHTHSILSFLTPDRLASELDSCFELLREKAGVGPAHFSYPEGLAHCYSDFVISELKRRGVRCSPTAIDGVNLKGTDPFHLRRVMVA